MHFGVVPVPNLCVELRGYDAAAVEGSSPSSSTPAASTAGATHAWPDWGEQEPRFLQLQRTGQSDGSFVFVTPDTEKITLVLAAYSNGGDHPDVIRYAFPPEDGPSSRSGGDKITATAAQEEEFARGETVSSAFGVDSGRLQMHIDLAREGRGGGMHAPEMLWSAASRENDQSPCARREQAVSSSSSSSGGAATRVADEAGDAQQAPAPSPPPTLDVPSKLGGGGGGGMQQDNDPPPAAATVTRDEEPSSTQQHVGGWPKFSAEVGRVYHASGFGDKVDQSATALTALLQSSYWNFVQQLGTGLWETSAAVCDFLRSWLGAAGHRVHESALARSAWSSMMELPSRFAQVSRELSSWFEQGSRQFSAWFGETSTLLFAWLELQSPVDLRAWWSVWWAKVGAVALVLGMLQQMFAFIYKCCSSSSSTEVVDPEDEGVVDDHRRRCCESPCQEEPASVMTSSMVGTFHGSDGRVSQLEIAKFGRPEESATTDEKKRKRSIFGAMWGSSSSSRESNMRAEEDINGGSREQEEGDDGFSSMFRALSQPSCTVMGSNEVDGVGGGASNVVVVTQQSWS